VEASIRIPAVPILAYHEVSPDPYPAFRRYTLKVSEFARQVRWLSSRGYQAIDLDTLLRARTSGHALPARPVLITFDDGFQACADHAVPVLQTYGFTATFFLVASLMGDTSRWMSEANVTLPLMSWARARALASAGFQFGSHTLTHPRLPGLDPTRRRVELCDSRRRLEDELGRPVLHFAYPYGAYDAAVRASVADAGYATACATRSGLSEPGEDLLALRRVTVHGHDSLLDFACRLRTGLAAGERLGHVLKGVARRLMGRAGPDRDRGFG
jgi:peptidoglycan/xylan/chitin deacetylase (PgdA/CDA1 family)